MPEQEVSPHIHPYHIITSPENNPLLPSISGNSTSTEQDDEQGKHTNTNTDMDTDADTTRLTGDDDDDLDDQAITVQGENKVTPYVISLVGCASISGLMFGRCLQRGLVGV